MLIYLLNLGVLAIAFTFIKFFRIKGRTKTKSIKLPHNYNDTSEAEYAINERGFLERIHHGKISSDAS